MKSLIFLELIVIGLALTVILYLVFTNKLRLYADNKESGLWLRGEERLVIVNLWSEMNFTKGDEKRLLETFKNRRNEEMILYFLNIYQLRSRMCFRIATVYILLGVLVGFIQLYTYPSSLIGISIFTGICGGVIIELFTLWRNVRRTKEMKIKLYKVSGLNGNI